MAEPKTIADRVDVVAPGVWHWSIHDDRIDFVGDAYAVEGKEGTVLIDPHPLAERALAELGQIAAICLTTSSHQRSSWRLRRELGVPVHAPALAKEVDEEPDARYSDGDELPGGLRTVFTPGAGTTQHTFLRAEQGGVAFVPDLFLRPPGGELALIPEQYAHDLEAAKRSARRLLDLPFQLLCLAHGGPVADDPKARIRAVLDA